MLGRARPHGPGGIEQPDLLADRHGPHLSRTGDGHHVDMAARRAQQLGCRAVRRRANQPPVIAAGDETQPIDVERQAEGGALMRLHDPDVMIRASSSKSALT